MPNTRLHNFVKSLETLADRTQREVISELKDGILNGVVEDMNINQLEHGTTAEGHTLPHYSQTSIKLFGKPDSTIKLKDTGEFYNKITAEVRGKNTLYLTDYSTKMYHKPAKLAQRYGNDIIGLTKKNIKKLSTEIREYALMIIKNIMN